MSGLSNLKTRLRYLGGDTAGRMNTMKLRSLESALKDSYQSEIIERYDGTKFQCLINPDQLKPDYDNKTISISSSAGMQAGDTFLWVSNNTHWLVYLPELTETAYFRAYIRRCRYKITIANSDYYIYVKGPSETSMPWTVKGGVAMNTLNGSLTIYVAKTDNSLEFFQKLNVIKLAGENWQVVSTDSLSIEGLIEISLVEFFNNSMEDLQNIPTAVPINTTVPHIVGKAFVKPYDTQEYSIALAADGTWSVSNAKAKIITSDSSTAKVEIISGKSGTFDLKYSRLNEEDVVLKVTIESL